MDRSLIVNDLPIILNLWMLGWTNFVCCIPVSRLKNITLKMKSVYSFGLYVKQHWILNMPEGQPDVQICLSIADLIKDERSMSDWDQRSKKWQRTPKRGCRAASRPCEAWWQGGQRVFTPWSWTLWDFKLFRAKLLACRVLSKLRLSEFVQISEFFSNYITDICQTSESFAKSVNSKWESTVPSINTAMTSFSPIWWNKWAFQTAWTVF